jgi:hypothetical protein
LHTEVCEIDQKLQAIVAGRKRHVLQSIQEETATNIYLPSPLQGLVGPDVASGVAMGPGTSLRQNKNTVWISGEFFGVQRARDMLLQLSLNKAGCCRNITSLPNTIDLQSKGIISRDTAILPRKLDWMVTDRAEDLKTIMSDNATFIQFPPIGSSTSLITVFGDHRVNIQRAIRSVMQLVCRTIYCLLPALTLPLRPVSFMSPLFGCFRPSSTFFFRPQP